MSYDIYIGNAELEAEWPGEDGPVAEWVVKGHAEADAPTFPFDGMTGNGNSRHPGYGQWGEFCRETGLYDLFFGVEYGEADPWTGRRARDGGILGQHPGIVPLTADMLATVRVALERWQAAHVDTEPGWDWQPYMRAETDDGVRGRDGNLARLLWLEWWMDWALRTCERPAVANH